MSSNKIDFIIGYAEKWNSPLRTSKHHYIKRLLNDGHRVLYIESPVNFFSILKHPKYFFCHHLSLLFKGPKEVEKNLWVTSGFVLLPYHPGFFGLFDNLLINKINQKFFSFKLKKTINKINFNNVFFIFYYPFLFPLIDQFKINKIIFHMVDEWQGMKGIPKTMNIITKNLISSADLTIVSSKTLKLKYEHLSNNIHILNHGTDYNLFSSVLTNKIEPLNNFKYVNGEFIIGYYGALHKLDFQLINNVSKKFPKLSFIFLGPLKGPQGFKLEMLLPSNVYFWDSISREKLPFFLKGIDIFWMPFKDNDLTKHMSPIKIFEVLSAGIPIITSDLESCRQIKSKSLLFARSQYDHINLLKNTIVNKASIDRYDTSIKMKKYDWNKRYNKFLTLIRNS